MNVPLADPRVNPNQLYIGYISQFQRVVDDTVIDRTDLSLEEKITCIEALMEILQLHMENPEEAVDYKLIGNIVTEKIVKPLRSKANPIYNAKLWQYFEPGSSQYLNYLSSETGRTSFTGEDDLTPKEHTNFLNQAFNLLSLSHTQLYLSSSAPEVDDPLNGNFEKPNGKEFTLRRQVLVMHYLDKAFNISNGSDRTHYAHLIELLTGKNYKNIYDYVREPFPDKISSRLVDDLKYIREYFVKLRLDQITTLIDKDIQLHK
jgi:hypothetical protein